MLDYTFKSRWVPRFSAERRAWLDENAPQWLGIWRMGEALTGLPGMAVDRPEGVIFLFDGCEVNPVMGFAAAKGVLVPIYAEQREASRSPFSTCSFDLKGFNKRTKADNSLPLVFARGLAKALKAKKIRWTIHYSEVFRNSDSFWGVPTPTFILKDGRELSLPAGVWGDKIEVEGCLAQIAWQLNDREEVLHLWRRIHHLKKAGVAWWDLGQNFNLEFLSGRGVRVTHAWFPGSVEVLRDFDRHTGGTWWGLSRLGQYCPDLRDWEEELLKG